MKIDNTFARSLVPERTWPVFLDLIVAAFCLAGFYAIIFVGRYWFSRPVPEVFIDRAPSALPLYAFYSVVRTIAAYFLSLIFAIGYGYIAAYNKRAESLMIAALDILQSIPVLSFLPGVMLAMIALIPGRQLGIELGAIVLIFTGQVWNMAFSFYSSLKSIPRELREACAINRFSAWQRFWQLELPFSAIGLIWNSMVSVAAGWFILVVCEMFPVGTRHFRLPGLGSYLKTAADAGDTSATVYGIITMMVIIVLTDQLVWRPLIAWSDKFKFETSDSGARVTSPILHLLRNSTALGWVRERTIEPLGERIYAGLARRRDAPIIRQMPERTARRIGSLSTIVLALIAVIAVALAAVRALGLLHGIPGSDYLLLFEGAAATFLRVNASLLIASLWTIPVGVAIGFNPRLAKILQPIIQMVASFPATVLYPIIILGLYRIGIGLGIGAVALMLLGTQWYVLFNVIAGAMAIPSEMREVADLFHFRTLQRWTTVILPGIFPYLVTGLVTASGGAWNASIIAEYYPIRDKIFTTLGLGAEISAASDAGNFGILLMGTIIMALMVVTANRLLWRKMYHLAETKYRLD
ncbi:ABC-type anion transport system, duplicated permease component [Acidisarcina polymorpha]|uniref:ABC-type anion transport system, duplicated permease component n=1 Tax=Acidisarcina polymorpha TaxID=2211140 RepID=A0A2Z5G653_9BACT|nr:ABC transporter permease subunit [Acidisarcina polymorpha]AXC14702.1 ABC-type anion transport system, duplicated permease component [Acidisarcina polymorpha]